PKAGGPLYLYRLLSDRPEDAVKRTFARLDEERPADAALREQLDSRLGRPLAALRDWAREQERGTLAELCDRYAADSQSGLSHVLNVPAGERKRYLHLPREQVLSHSEV